MDIYTLPVLPILIMHFDFWIAKTYTTVVAEIKQFILASKDNN